uniref:Serine/arginine repetitive matrix protein 2-like n=1 Tax=Steinernema glaseri TaxID=37863 RepID=A0A1I7XVP2_9BILA
MHESRRARTHTSGGSRYAAASRGGTANGPRPQDSPSRSRTRPGTSKGSFHRLGTAKASAKVEPEGSGESRALVSGSKKRILRKGKSFGKHDDIEVKEDEHRSQSTNLTVPGSNVLVVHEDEDHPEPPPPPSNEVTVVAQIERIPPNMMKVVEEEAIPPEPETTVPSPVPSVPHAETGKLVVDEPEEGENEDADVVVIKGKDSSDVFMIEVPVQEHEVKTPVQELKAEDLIKAEPKSEVPKKPRRTTSKKSLKSNKSARSIDSKKARRVKEEMEPPPHPVPSVQPGPAEPKQVDEAPPGGNNVVQPRIPPTKGKFAGLAKVYYSIRTNTYG